MDFLDSHSLLLAGPGGCGFIPALERGKVGLKMEEDGSFGAQEILVVGVSLTGGRTSKGISTELQCSQISKVLRSP